MAVFKTDFAEGVPADAVAYNGMTGVELHNVYTLLFNDIVADSTEEVAGTAIGAGRSSTWAGSGTAPSGAGTSTPPGPAWPAPCAAGCPTGCPGCRWS